MAKMPHGMHPKYIIKYLNLKCRYISGPETEMSVHIRTWTWNAGTCQDLNLKCRYISGPEPEMSVHIRTWTWNAGTYQDLNLKRRYISGPETETPIHIRTWPWNAGKIINYWEHNGAASPANCRYIISSVYFYTQLSINYIDNRKNL